MKERGLDVVLALINIFLVGLLVWVWYGAWTRPRNFQPAVLPSEVVAPPVIEIPQTTPTSSPASSVGVREARAPQRPAELNLAVPFMSQAPLGNWDMPYQEACEEASVRMAVAFVKKDQRSWAPEDIDKEILEIVQWEQEHFGFYEDTTLAEVNEILIKKFGITTARIVANPSAKDLRGALAQGSIILAPFYGRELPNPHFSGEGPLYHMLVIKGYTEEGFITNDPGTKFGRNFFYTDEALLGALHDWNGGDVEQGQKVVLVVSK